MNMIRNEDKGKRSEERNIMQRDTSDMRDKRWRRLLPKERYERCKGLLFPTL